MRAISIVCVLASLITPYLTPVAAGHSVGLLIIVAPWLWAGLGSPVYLYHLLSHIAAIVVVMSSKSTRWPMFAAAGATTVALYLAIHLDFLSEGKLRSSFSVVGLVLAPLTVIFLAIAAWYSRDRNTADRKQRAVRSTVLNAGLIGFALWMTISSVLVSMDGAGPGARRGDGRGFPVPLYFHSRRGSLWFAPELWINMLSFVLLAGAFGVLFKVSQRRSSQTASHKL